MASEDDRAASRFLLKLLLTQTAVETLVYGCYAILFAISLYTLRRRPLSHQKLHITAFSSLFVFATIATALDIITTADDLYSQFDLGGLTGSFTSQDSLILTHYAGWMIQFVYILADLVADAILLYRCYVVWGFRKRIIAFPVFIYVVNNVIGLVYEFIFLAVHISDERPSTILLAENSLYFNADQLSFAYMIITTILNVMLTCLLAARIWWIQYQLFGVLGRGIDYRRKQRIYHSIVAIIVESGLLYPICLIVFNVLLNTIYSPNLYPLLTQLVGIAPTLIIIRVSLGISTDGVDDTTDLSHTSNRRSAVTSDLLFATRPGLGSSHTALQLEPISHSTDGRSEIMGLGAVLSK